MFKEEESRRDTKYSQIKDATLKSMVEAHK